MCRSETLSVYVTLHVWNGAGLGNLTYSLSLYDFVVIVIYYVDLTVNNINTLINIKNLMWTVVSVFSRGVHELTSFSWTAAQSITSREAWSAWRPLFSLWPRWARTAWFPWRTWHCTDWHRLTGDLIQDWVVARQMAWWEEWQSKQVERSEVNRTEKIKDLFQNI